MKELFEKHMDEEFLKFDRVQNQMSKCPDIHAFILLESLAPMANNKDMVSSTGYDEIWLGVDVDEVAAVITEDQVIELIRCGVRYDADYQGFCMFV